MEAFDRFVLERKEDLQRIARHTRGECTYGDVVNEAWLMAQTLSLSTHHPAGLLDAAVQKLLLSHLYQHLVRYTDLHVRHAVRLDHSPTSDAAPEASHPLLNMLSDEKDDPLSCLLSLEEKPARPSLGNEQHSMASVYLTLLGHFNNSMRSVARYLLISLSQAYRCCAKARLLTARQHALVLAPPPAMSVLKPWRCRRALRIPRQMEFDFEDKLPLAGVGATQATYVPVVYRFVKKKPLGQAAQGWLSTRPV